MSEIAGLPVQPLETQYAAGQAAAESGHHSWRKRLGQVVGRTALVLGLAGGTAAVGLAEAQPALAADASCYGDYCSGKYANETGCDDGANTIVSRDVLQNGMEISVEASSDPGVSFSSSPNSNKIGTLELRHSEKCHTYWAKFSSTGGASADIRGVNFVGIEQDTGYTQKRDIGGLINGSPAAISYTPMVYDHNDVYTAFIEAKDYAIAYRVSTEWSR